MSYKIHKDQRLKSEKAINHLFLEGKSLFIYPIKLQYRFVTPDENHKPGLKFAVSVSKKHFKRAVDRNLIKRRLREAFRLEKNALELQTLTSSVQLECMLIFVGKTISEYPEIHKGVKIITSRLAGVLHKKSKSENLPSFGGEEDGEMI